MTIHPSIRIIAFILLAVLIQRLSLASLFVLAFPLMALLVLVKAKVFVQMMRRMRWLLIIMLLIYAFSTPGEYLAEWPFWVTPTYEGIQAGLIQAMRLTVMLAGLALLLRLTVRDKLIVGFFFLMQPLRYIGLDPERFAARLWLTLHYVEQPQQKQTAVAMFERLKDFHLEDNDDDQRTTIQLELQTFGWLDYFVLFVILTLGIALS